MAASYGSRPSPHEGIPTPLPRGQDPTLAEQQIRVLAFRQRLGNRAGVTEFMILRLLRDQGWDLDAALHRYQWEVDNRVIPRHIHNQPGRNARQIGEDRLMAASSVHQNHRLAIVQLQTIIANSDPQNPRRQQQNTLQLASQLQSNGWDLDRARESYLRQESSPAEAAEQARQERRLRMIPQGQNQPNQCHKDQRLALFLDFAGTDDWVSVRAHLASSNWDVGRACDEWMIRGIRKAYPSREELARNSYHKPRLPHDESDNLWQDRPLAGLIIGIDSFDQADANDNYGDGDYMGQTGWVYHQLQSRAHTGVREPARMEGFAIRNGYGVRYEYKHYESNGPPGYFDWDHPEDISSLNKWAGQLPRRVMNKKGHTPIAYLPDEDQWIYNWHRARTDEFQQSNPGPGEVVYFDTAHLETDFNAFFGGRTDVAGAAGNPRPTRTRASLDMRRRRNKDITRDFPTVPPSQS